MQLNSSARYQHVLDLPEHYDFDCQIPSWIGTHSGVMLMDSIRENLKQQICSLLTLDLARNSHSICDLILLLLFPCKRKNGSCSFHCADPIFNFGYAQRILWIQFSSLIRFGGSIFPKFIRSMLKGGNAPGIPTAMRRSMLKNVWSSWSSCLKIAWMPRLVDL